MTNETDRDEVTEDVIGCLRAAKREHDRERMGRREAGREWAKDTAEVAELVRLNAFLRRVDEENDLADLFKDDPDDPTPPRTAWHGRLGDDSADVSEFWEVGARRGLLAGHRRPGVRQRIPESRRPPLEPGQGQSLSHASEAPGVTTGGFFWIRISRCRKSRRPIPDPDVSISATQKGGRLMILTVAGLKGGVAKTTTALHLTHFLNLRAPAVLVDADPNRTATGWGIGAPPPSRSSPESGCPARPGGRTRRHRHPRSADARRACRPGRRL